VNLRDYQLQARNLTRTALKEFDSALIVMPTGTGKTIVFSSLIRSVFPFRSIVVAHRAELIFQAKNQIHAVTGLRVDVEMGKYRAANESLFGLPTAVVASIQTLTSGGDGFGRMGKFDPMQFRLCIIDEAHHATSASYRKFIDYCRSNPALKVVGVTATPDRADEEALGQVFETVAFDYEILDAIKDGWLVPITQQMVDVSGLDYSTVKTTAGDLNNHDLAAVMESEQNLHGVASPTLDIIGDRSTLVFTASVKHAEQLAEIFNRHKPGMADWVCGKTDPDDRNLINEKFKSGEIQILCNCGTHTEGFDADVVSVIVMARPTKSRSLYGQMVGRATRPLRGIVDGQISAEARREAIALSAKPSCLIVDFVGNSGKHKLVTSVDILGGNVSEDVLESTLRKLRKAGKPADVAKAIEEEEKEKAEREARRLAEAARREKLVLKASYKTSSVDPFDVLQVKPVKARGWDQNKTLSEKQRNALRRFGVDPDKVLREKGYTNAKHLLDAFFNRIDKHLCTFNQAKTLQRFGYSKDLTFDQARTVLDNLAKNGWKKPVLSRLPPPRQRSVAPVAASDKGAGSSPPPLTRFEKTYDPDDNVPF
jgi:superfamily II DNA or RNA helicase